MPSYQFKKKDIGVLQGPVVMDGVEGCLGFCGWFPNSDPDSSNVWLSAFIKILFKRRRDKFWETAFDYQHFGITYHVCLSRQQ